MNHNAAVQNALWLIVGKTARMGISLVLGLLTARYLGPDNYGLLSYAAAYTGFFSAFCTLGLNAILVKELTDTPEKTGEILGTALFLRGLSGILSSGAILSIVYMSGEEAVVLTVTALFCAGMTAQSFEVFHYYFQSRLQSRVTAIVLLAARLITAGAKAVLLILEKSVSWFAMAAAAEQLCIAVFLLTAYRQQGGRRLRISRERGRKLLQKSRHFILPGVMVAIYAQTDKIMLRQMVGQTALGYYSTAVSVSGVWCFVLSAIIDSMYPEIAKLHKIDKKRFVWRNKQLYAIIFYLSAAAAVLIVLFAEPLVTVLYGEAYLPAAAPLRILAWYTGFSYLGVARNIWVVCENRQKDLVWVYLAAAVCNVGLNFLLIPAWGAAGAAAASLAAQVVSTLIAPFFIRSLRENGKLMLEALICKKRFRD